MLDIDARVDDIGAGSLAGARVVHVRRLVDGPVRDARKTPRHVGLLDLLVDGEDGVLLNIIDLGEVLHLLESLAAEVGGETAEFAVAVDVRGLEPLDGVLESAVGSALLELDDVAARDELRRAGLDDGCREGEREKGRDGGEMHRERWLEDGGKDL